MSELSWLADWMSPMRPTSLAAAEIEITQAHISRAVGGLVSNVYNCFAGCRQKGINPWQLFPNDPSKRVSRFSVGVRRVW